MTDVADLRLVDLPGGQVRLSDRRSERDWLIEVAPFAIADSPVTVALYDSVHDSMSKDGRLPLVDVTWWDAVRFCNALSVRHTLSPAYVIDEPGERITWNPTRNGYRIPTEAEWEYACRAGTRGPRYGDLDDIAWYRENSGEQIRQVRGKAPNPWGLHDTLGLVWEWCWDVYDPQVYGTYRVLRGGGWFDEHWSCRASVRRRSHPTLRLDDVGFRLARSGTASE
ncbi:MULTISPECIES: formylglycine-generating enzyme family protein [Pseudonocardia]|uniref:formylglycine-generating enzyme family protein n=1 Tax=Pseudonocardia TaxID=1847 RepID=UPI0010F0156F|nr:MULTISPECIES: formylglycine-generating enzyme family protein [Pseudonocardia]TDN73981.1 formylglycine-generating enzyme required for sulfatase activity [Pseudonocardia autotrophica]